jgi:hypothetical protein
MAGLNRLGFVYTPQVTLQGKDYRGWDSPSRFADAVGAINQRPPRAELGLRLTSAPVGLSLTLNGKVIDPATRPGAQVFIALYENQLSTRVPAGENAGRTLSHDHVVRLWRGPFPVGGGGRIELSEVFPLDKDWNPARFGAAAFVQAPGSGDILQAVALPACPI